MKQVLALILCLCLAASLFACGGGDLRSPGNFYYYRAETSYSGADGVIAPEQRELAGLQSDLGALLELYCLGPKSPDLENPLPHGAHAEDFTLEDGVLTLRFSPSLAGLSGIELTVAAGCLARTFLELTGADTMILTAGGALLNGETSMILTLSDLGLRDDSLDLLHETFTVYYADPNRRYLIAQEVCVNLAAQEDIPSYLLQQLLTAPAGSGLRSALPDSTRIQSVTVENGLCTVDLSAEFESRRFFTHTGKLLSLMSVVNTLTALDGIERVEFSVDGNLLIRYGPISISQPLVRDERFLGPVRTGLGELDATLCLAHGTEPGLISIPARIRQTSAYSQAELLLRTLLSDPGTNDLSTRIPAGTRVNRVCVEDGICYVDLSEAYLNAPEDLLWSGRVIAASVCALEDVSGVQITVNGAVPGEFDQTLFGILVPDEDWFL